MASVSDIDTLIYEKSNTYRLHADNLRWTLLAGYGAFFAAAVGFADEPFLTAILYLVSIAYTMILAVQHWFYNLFARFVKECEHRLRANEQLRPMEEFAVKQGYAISPFHPAFLFALAIVNLSSVWFLITLITQLWPSRFTSEFLQWAAAAVALLGHFAFFALWMRRWNDWVYVPLIKPMANLWKPLPQDLVTKRRQSTASPAHGAGGRP